MENFKNKILQRFMMSPEDMEAYSEPSIMDEYIRKNDPEQYENIEHAKRAKEGIGMGSEVGGPMGMIGKVAQVGAPAMMRPFGAIRKSLEESGSDLAKNIHAKSFASLNPAEKLGAQKFGNVISKDIPEQGFGNVIKQELPEQGFGKIIGQQSPETEASLMERVNRMNTKLDEDPRLIRLRQLAEERRKQMGQN